MLDALPFLGSSASVGLMKDLSIEGVVPDDTIREWVLAMSFIPRPDQDMLSSAFELLAHISSDSSINLGVAALTHTYCVQHNDCDQDENIKGGAYKIIKLLENRATKEYQTQGNSTETVWP